MSITGSQRKEQGEKHCVSPCSEIRNQSCCVPSAESPPTTRTSPDAAEQVAAVTEKVHCMEPLKAQAEQAESRYENTKFGKLPK